MKMLASDYDGTLHFKDGYHAEDLEAIRRFQAAGNKFGLCSGRPMKNLLELETKDIRFDFVIGASGAAFADKGKIVYEKTIPYPTFEKIYSLMDGHNLFVSTKTGMYGSLADIGFLTGWCELADDLASPDLVQDQDIVHVSIEYETLEEIEAVLPRLEALRNEVAFYQNGPSVDFVPKGYSKKRGIDFAASFYGLEAGQVACIGDNYNDLPMIEGVPDSYTFDFAPAGIQKKAKHVVSSLAQCIAYLMEEDNENTGERF